MFHRRCRHLLYQSHIIIRNGFLIVFLYGSTTINTDCYDWIYHPYILANRFSNMTDLEFVREQVSSVFDGEVIFDLPAPRATLDTIEECRGYCKENICGNYGRSCTCPPRADPPEICIERLESFPKTMLVMKRYVVDLKNKDKVETCLSEMQQICRDIHVSLSGSNVRNLPLANGPCKYCANCSCDDEKGCRFPQFKVSSVSPYGIMINKYLESVGIPPEPVGDSITLYGFVLYD